MNQVLNVADFDTPHWKNILDEMHRLMRVPRSRQESMRHCTDRRAFLGRAEIESYKHWEYPWLVKYGEFQSGMRVLDCGSGRGFIQIYLARFGCRMTSVDISTLKAKWIRAFWRWMDRWNHSFVEDKTSAIRALARRYGCEIDFHCVNMATLPFPAQSFDRVYSISVLEHIEEGDDEKAILEMARVVKPGGLVLITVDFSPRKILRKSYDIADIERLIKLSGLELVGEKDFVIKDWEHHKKQLQKTFLKLNVEVSTAGFVLRKPAAITPCG